jgi:DNA-binding LytR/AlgR family response regulator
MAEPMGGSLCGRRLIIVEDEYLIAINLAEALEDSGAEIAGLAGSVEDARALIEAEKDRLDGAVLDVNLGGDRVYPVADMLMACRVPFVFATGYDLWAIPGAYAAAPRCEKPIRISILARLLAEQMA